MNDTENTVSQPVAPESNSAPSEQVATTEMVAPSPEQIQPVTEEPLLAGKYKSPQELEKAYKELESKLGSRTPAYVPAEQVPQPGYAPAPLTNVPTLDPDAEIAVRNLVRQETEAAAAARFEVQHAAELASPVLRGTIASVIQDENRAGRYISQEDALSRAKDLVAQATAPQVKQAETDGFAQGQDLGRAKEKAGAIGDTNRVAPPVNEEAVSAAEYAKINNIPRFNG